MNRLRSSGVPIALFAVMVGAFAVVARTSGMRSPLAVIALLALEVAAIGIALAAHVAAQPNTARRADETAERAYVEVDYL